MNPGDYGLLRLAKDEIEGTILPSHDSSIVLFKLTSGYNIGIPKDHIQGFELIRKAQTKKIADPIKTRKDLPSIGLIMTGGTIASKLDPITGGVSALTDVNEFAKFYPKLFEIANVKEISVPFMKLSENMNSDDWQVIGEHVVRMMNDKSIEGIVITHGTDFLHYTAAALSFFIPKPNKPVVLTYSQRSIDRASSDADLNLRCAARMALSENAEIVLVGHAGIQDDYCFALRGTKVRKMHTSRRDAFKPVNTEPIAKVWPDKVEFLSTFKARHSESVEGDITFNDKVALIKFYPGQGPEILDYYFKEGYKGAVIEVAGIGNLAAQGVKHSWTSTVKRLTKDGFVICGAAQTVYGRLHPLVYSVGRELESAGMIFLQDMLAETAFVKLGWCLGHRTWKGKINEKMLENVAGEFNHLLTE